MAVRDAEAGQLLPAAVVYLHNDEDPVVQLGWTDASGAVVLGQRYARGTVVVHERLALGLFASEVSRQVRFPRFTVRAARTGYLPAETRFGAERFAPGLETGLVAARVRLAGAVEAKLDRLGPAVRPAPVRHVAMLFAAPARTEVRVGARGPVYDGRFTRLWEHRRPRLDAAVRAWLGPNGEQVVICGSIPVATADYHKQLEVFASTADLVLYTPPLGPTLPPIDPDPEHDAQRQALRRFTSRLALVTQPPARRPARWQRIVPAQPSREPALSPAFLEALLGWASLEKPDEIVRTLRTIALQFATELESARADLAAKAADRLVVQLVARVRNDRTTAVVCEPAVGAALQQALRARGYRPLCETWLPAWRIR
ncbi:MAG: hypothetical protein D6776_04300 [Planctomycetota bacterium]|nr:MAG: hypothetical protein D6776_04300 [Planctomycetota bacterium]